MFLGNNLPDISLWLSELNQLEIPGSIAQHPLHKFYKQNTLKINTLNKKITTNKAIVRLDFLTWEVQFMKCKIFKYLNIYVKMQVLLRSVIPPGK